MQLYLSLQCNHLLDAWQAVLVNKFLQSLEVVNLVFLITMVSDLFSKKAVIDFTVISKTVKTGECQLNYNQSVRYFTYYVSVLVCAVIFNDSPGESGRGGRGGGTFLYGQTKVELIL